MLSPRITKLCGRPVEGEFATFPASISNWVYRLTREVQGFFVVVLMSFEAIIRKQTFSILFVGRCEEAITRD